MRTGVVAKILLFTFSGMFLTAAVFADAGGEFKHPQGRDSRITMATSQGHLYEGMTRRELYEIYPPRLHKDYNKNANEEWVVFDDILTDDLKDTITVYLVDGKVKGWNKVPVPIDPKDRLKALMDRQKYGTAQPDALTYRDKGLSEKANTRRREIEEEKKYGYRQYR